MASHPVLPFLVAAVLLPLVPRRVQVLLALAAPVASGVLLAGLDRGDSVTTGFYGYQLEVLRFDDLAAPFAYVFVLIALLAGLFGARTMGAGERSAALVYAACGLGVVLAGDLLTLFVFWEVKAVASAVLIAAARRPGSNAAAMRYLMVHVVGGTLLIGGVLWHLSDGGSLAFGAFDSNPAAHLVMVAFLLSAAVPPLHAWLPDAYPEASIAGTVFLSAFTTKAAVYALLRGFAGTDVLIALGVFMALYGVVYAVIENDLRRLLGYHIVSQVGFMVAAVGIGTAAAVNGATAHAFAHILYKGLLLMGAGAVLHATGRSKLSELGGLARSMPWVLVLYLVGALSISGLPLLSGFVSKELVVDAARADGMDLVLHLLKLASVGTFLSTALKIPWFGFGGPDRGIACRALPRSMLVAMGITALLNVVLGLHPGLLYDLLPHDVGYEPYTAYKLVEILQLLAFTGLAFWLLVRKLGTEPTITLDTDWLYRAPPRLLAGAATDVAARAGAVRASWVRQARRIVRQPVLAELGEVGRTPPVAPTTALGALTLVAFVLVLALSLLP